ncbi:MAG: hypothetical protein NXI10_05450 [bacterium]|nr:hypothetical protein [bacterium]
MEAKKKKGAGVYILVGAAVIAVSAGIYYFVSRSKNAEEPTKDFEPQTPSTPPAPTQPTVTPRTNSSYSSSKFPLRRGSRGQYVRQLQQALVARYGSSILPRYGVDGDWGSETTNALSSKGLPTVIYTYSMLQTILEKIALPSKSTSSNQPKKDQGSTSSSGATMDNPKAISVAKNLRWHIRKRNFKGVNYFLSLIKNKADYQTVNEFFKASDMHDGTKRTLVTGVLRFFKDSFMRDLITKHFYRMGLKKRNGKWSLGGLGQILYDQIQVIKDAKVWNAQKLAMQVPKNTILGEFISAKHGVTKFRTIDGKELFTATSNVRYV